MDVGETTNSISFSLCATGEKASGGVAVAGMGWSGRDPSTRSTGSGQAGSGCGHFPDLHRDKLLRMGIPPQPNLLPEEKESGVVTVAIRD